MTDFTSNIQHAIAAMSGWEVLAVILGVSYLLLAMRNNILCWYAALGSSTIYVFLFWDVSLPMESALSVYYVVMAFYGWWQWRGGAAPAVTDLHSHQPIVRWSLPRHAIMISAVLLLSFGSGYLLEKNTQAALPYLDSFTTWGALLTTWMVAKRVLENWLYWIVVDSAAIVLYLDRELYLTALLMAVYVVLVIIGWFQWLPLYRQQQRQQQEQQQHKAGQITAVDNALC